jgi:hypothetical protein
VEYSNEIWNDQFSQGLLINDQGVAQYAGRAGSDFDKRLNRFGERTAQICQLWRTAFGSQADRVRCVMAGQAANSYIAETALNCPLSTLAPCRNKGIYGLAIAPYVGDHIGLPQFETTVAGWTQEADGGLNRLFNEMNTGTELKYEGLSGMPIVRSRISAHAVLAKQQNIAMVAYEGGQHLVGVGEPANNAAINTLMDAANRDARMGTLYAAYLQEWATAGGGLFMHFSDVGSASRYGRWGALELVTQTSSPKSDALQTFAQARSESTAACIFGWAERTFPTLFTPAAVSQRLAPYYFRSYGSGAAANHLASTWPEQRLLALGAATGGQLVNLGHLHDFALTAACL